MPASENLNDFYQDNKKILNEYLETRFEIFKLRSIKILSKTISLLLLISIVAFMTLFFFLFIVISFSWWMSELLGSSALGFLLGGGVFLLSIIVCILFRKPLFVNPFIRLFIRASLQEDEENEDEY